jgi:hypothetical protein
VAFHAVARDAVRHAHNSADVGFIHAIADRQGWLVGETLEHALAALQRELTRG